MSWQIVTKSIELSDGRTIKIETGKMARQADGAVLVTMGKAALLATVVSKTEMRDGIDFFPLSVDYQEKFAAAGRIPGGFLKREGRLSEYEVLICRLVDRALRPTFPKGYRYDTQVLISLLSHDPEVMPDSLAGLAASAAICISDIPFNGPISEVRVARVEGEFVVNPSPAQLAASDMDFMLAANEDSIVMVEGEADECSEEDFVEALKIGHDVVKQQCAIQRELMELCGKSKREVPELPTSEEVKTKVYEFAKDKVYEVAKGAHTKHDRSQKFKAIKEELVESFGEEVEEETLNFVYQYYKELEKEVVRSIVLEEGVRLDGRVTTDIRPLTMEIDLLASPHGSALFTRGETQSLTSVTLGSKVDEQMLDKASGLEYSNFLLHYNFPPYSTGEARPIRGTSRRETGHGNLAMRSLKKVLPAKDDFPYTIRIVSDILESNGSSSMATVCAGSLALMDAGVPLKSGVSGIAMGLISGENGKVAILSDILGDEDFLGDMDFKVAGTSEGITAVQMDIKIAGLSFEVLTQALFQAKEGRAHILNAMNETISEGRAELKPQTPRIERIFVAKEFIGAIIGPGGKVIQEMQRNTNTTINIQEVGDEGEVTIYGVNKESLDSALEIIKGITTVPEVGEVYESTVKSVMPYGAFVEFLPGKEGLLHISEISWKRLESMDGVLEEGDKVKVKLIGVDNRSGKFKLSRKVLIPNPYENDPNYKSSGRDKDRGYRDNKRSGGYRGGRGGSGGSYRGGRDNKRGGGGGKRNNRY